MTIIQRPRAFLDSIGNNGPRTRSNYSNWACPLFKGSSFNRFNGECSVDSVIDLILHNQVNVYELLDNFVTFEGSKKKQEKNKPQSIKTHLIGIKSLFAYYDVDIIPSKFKRKVKVPKTLQKKRSR